MTIRLLLFLLASALAAAPAWAATRVDAALERRVQSGPTRVLVVLAAATAKAGDSASKRALAEQRDAVLATLPAGSVALRRQFELLPAFAAEINAAALDVLRADARVRAIELDQGGSGGMLQAAPLAHISELVGLNVRGQGAKIALLDSGISRNHPDFSGRVIAEQCFCSADVGTAGCCPNGRATQSGTGAALDEHGHGTNVGGIFAGAGAVAAPGVAAAADIVAVRILDRNNSFCCFSDVLAAFDWVRNEHPEVRTINASIGTSSLYADDCDSATGTTGLAAAALESLWQNGTLVVSSAGNQRASNAMSLPACLSRALGVGASWDLNTPSATVFSCTDAPVSANQATCFSNSSAATDLYAPGAYITSSGLNGGTSTYAGSSQASPLVAGCAAVIRTAVPGARASEVRAALLASPDSVTDAKNGRSFPRLNCADALTKLRAVSARNHSGFYSAPANPGYALNLTHQDDTIAIAWYTYAENRRPVWFTAAATLQADGSYRGEYSLSTGLPFQQINGAAASVSTSPRGSLTLRFRENALLDLDFLPSGTASAQHRVLEPLVFGANPPQCRFTNAARSNASNVSDLWWNPSESGWGLSLAEQAGSIFMAWYTYASDGQPQWVTGLLARQADGSYIGALTRAGEGTPYTLPPDGPLTPFPLPTVGDATLRFVNGESGSFRYTLDGSTRTVAIERFAFGRLRQLCE